MDIEKTVEDVRGKIFFLSQNNCRLNLVEIKKGYSRGGHFHKFTSNHILLSGKIEYREEDVDTLEEKKEIIVAPKIIQTIPRKAHLLTAIEDTVFIEVFENNYDAENYPKYRKIVEEKM